MKARVLIVEDRPELVKLIKGRLERENFEVVTASNIDEAKTAFQAGGGEFTVMVTDNRMVGQDDGLKLIGWTKENHPSTRSILMTAFGEKDVAVQALKKGASDYLDKPFDLDTFMHSVQRCAKEARLESENRELMGRLQARVERVEGRTEDSTWYVSKDPAMGQVNEWLSVLRRESMRGEAEEPTVLIVGESGTGKEGIARMVHSGSRRARGPWIAVNCANFSEQLLESELFGHERGAFTGAVSMKRGLFELARGGTLFLDEIGEMDVKLQAKLLRVLQEKTFRRVGGTSDIHADVRVVAATHRDIRRFATEGKFREDLFHRISRVVVDLPALRDRREDVIPMATQFADRAFRSRGKVFPGFAPEAQEGIATYSWPGNVRELMNVVDRAALVWQGTGAIPLRSLSLPVVPTRANGQPRLELVPDAPAMTAESGATPGTPVFQLTDAVDEAGYMGLKKRWGEAFERDYLVTTLARHAGNVSAAAREAKLDRSNFLRLLRRHHLNAQQFRKGAISVATPATGTEGGAATGTGTAVSTPKAA